MATLVPLLLGNKFINIHTCLPALSRSTDIFLYISAHIVIPMTTDDSGIQPTMTWNHHFFQDLPRSVLWGWVWSSLLCSAILSSSPILVLLWLCLHSSLDCTAWRGWEKKKKKKKRMRDGLKKCRSGRGRGKGGGCFIITYRVYTKKWYIYK